jgi:hypothetical protein
MHVDGSCYCGAIRFAAEIDPKRVGLCHCTDCQTFSSSAFRASVMVPDERFELLEGTPAVFEKTAESGARRELRFCARCGTHLYGSSSGGGGGRVFHSVRLGALAQREQLAPVAQVWCRSAVPWLDRLPELPRVETQ